MKKLAVLMSVLAIFFPFNTGFAIPNTQKTLAKLENLDDYPSTEGNEAILSKTKTGCALNLTVYGESGQLQDVYHFKGNRLLSAYKIETSYQNGGLSNPQNKTVKFNKPTKTVLNVKESQTIQAFHALKAQFPQASLALCQH